MFIAFLLYMSLLFLAPQDQGPAAIAKTIAAAYDANCALITHGSAKIFYSVGMADDLEAALAGRWSDRTDAKGEFALDLPRARYDQLFDTKELIAKRNLKGGGGYSTRLISGRVVTDGSQTLNEAINIGRSASGDVPICRLTIFAGTDAFLKLAHLPLDLGVPTPEGAPGRVIRDAIDGRNGWRIASVMLDASLEGVKVAEVVIETGKTGRGRLWFDLNRGAVPLQIRNESSDGKQFSVERYDDLHELPGGAWLPYRRTDFNDQKLANQIVLQDAHFDRVPGQENFRMKLAKAEPVFDEVHKRRYAAGDTWDLAKLPAPDAIGNFPILDRSDLVSAPVMPGELRAWPNSAIVIVSLGVVLVVLSLFLYWRRGHA